MTPDAQDPLDFTAKYNTPIPSEKQTAFNNWVAQKTKATGKNPLGDKYDYDVQGYWLSGAANDPRGHGPDTFKKPNHPTFSIESKYNGVDGYTGGSWSNLNGQGYYLPSNTNLTFRSPEQLKQYFGTTEPDTVLIPPTPKAPTITPQGLSLGNLLKGII
jgi:hypothetical protein